MYIVFAYPFGYKNFKPHRHRQEAYLRRKQVYLFTIRYKLQKTHEPLRKLNVS